METPTKTEVLLEVIERRLAEISERQHALAVERARLAEQLTPLRLGVTSPDLAVALLRAKGVALRRLAPSAVDRIPPEVVLRAVVSPHPKVTPLPSRSETA